MKQQLVLSSTSDFCLLKASLKNFDLSFFLSCLETLEERERKKDDKCFLTTLVLRTENCQNFLKTTNTNNVYIAATFSHPKDQVSTKGLFLYFIF